MKNKQQEHRVKWIKYLEITLTFKLNRIPMNFGIDIYKRPIWRFLHCQYLSSSVDPIFSTSKLLNDMTPTLVTYDDPDFLNC
jgi:hypothetical protein